MVKCSKARHPTSGWPPRQAAAAQSLPSARWLWVWQGSTATGSAAPAYSGRCTSIRDGEEAQKERKYAGTRTLPTKQASPDYSPKARVRIGMDADEGAARSFAPKAEKLAESLKKYQSESTSRRELYEVAASTQIEAKAVVERNLRAFNAHDLEAVARDAAPEIELTSPGDIKVKGPQAAKEYNQNWVKWFPDARVEAKQILGRGTTTTAEAAFT